MSIHHVIAVAYDQYALARGNCDIEYTRVLMTSGERKTLEDGDQDLDAYFQNHEAYWASHGWVKNEPIPGKWGLVHVGKAAAMAALAAEDGPEVEDGCDHEGFKGGCERFGHTPETCPNK